MNFFFKSFMFDAFIFSSAIQESLLEIVGESTRIHGEPLFGLGIVKEYCHSTKFFGFVKWWLCDVSVLAFWGGFL